MNIYRILLPLLVSLLLSSCAYISDELKIFKSDDANSLNKAIPLLAIPIANAESKPGPTPENGDGEREGSGKENDEVNTPVHNLFDLEIGTMISMSRIAAGTIDPVGTSLANDYDGDGILNQNETTTNIWVADYPMITTSITTPITLKIEILETTTNTTEDISTTITSDDIENVTHKGSTDIERTSVNDRTVEYLNEFSKKFSTEADKGFRSEGDEKSQNNASNTGGTVLPTLPLWGLGYDKENPLYCGIGNSRCALSSEETGKSLDFKTIPFQDDLQKNETSVISDKATKYAHQVRKEFRLKKTTTTTVKDNAGFVRAAFYIENNSVNMPVRLRKILCSLVFRAPTGEIIPIQSFLLRNDDYTPFEVNVYGGQKFGPYVIELAGLNTAEVKNAIQMGYLPQIHIVDYEMNHVPDSNYRSVLLNYSGDNLKIIEENAKGRTAQIKINAPNIRKLLRVAAFETNGGSNSDICSGGQGNQVAPGIALSKALKRISCSGVPVEFGDYVIDLGDSLSLLPKTKFHVRGIKSLYGISTNLPCIDETHTGSDGITRTACIQKPVSQWTDDEINNAGLWVVFSDGAYFAFKEYIQDSGTIRTFNTPGAGQIGIGMVKGIDSNIWAGDRYEIAYIRYRDFLTETKQFGTNPLETGAVFVQDTRWDLNEVGNKHFDPDVHSTYLGQAGFGEEIELRFKLTENQYLQPSFGNPVNSGGVSTFTDFRYNQHSSTDRVTREQMADFEISLGFGGQRTDWFHISKDLNDNDPQKPNSCGVSLDYVNQEFYMCIQLPTAHPFVDIDVSLIHLYLRPALNSAYRNTVWPLAYDEVRKFRGNLAENALSGATDIKIETGTGSLAIGDVLRFDGDAGSYLITNAPILTNGVYNLNLNTGLSRDFIQNDYVYVEGNLTEPYLKLKIDDDFVANYNSGSLSDPYGSFALWESEQKVGLNSSSNYSCQVDDFDPLKCLGFESDYVAINWMGGYNFGVPNWNAWSDAGDFSNFLSKGLPGISAASGKGMRFESKRKNIRVNKVTTNLQADSRVAVEGNRALVVWASNENGSDSDIRARIVDTETGEPIGLSDILVSTTNAGDQNFPHVKISNGRAMVMWDSLENGNDSNVRGRVIEMTTGQPLGSSDFLLHSNAAGNQFIQSTFLTRSGNNLIAASGNFALSIFSSNPVSGNIEVRGVIVNLTTGNTIGGDFLIDSTPQARWGHIIPTQIVNNGDHAILSWYIFKLNDNSHNPEEIGNYAQVIDIPTGTKIGNKLPLSSGLTASSAKVGIWTNKAIISWCQSDRIKARIVDISTASFISPEIDVAPISRQSWVKPIEIATWDNKALLIPINETSGNMGLYGYFIDLTQGNILNSQPIELSPYDSTKKENPFISVSNGQALVSWDNSNGSTQDIYARFIDMNNMSLLYPAPFQINIPNGANNVEPKIAFSDDRGYVVWRSYQNSDSNIYGQVIDINTQFTFPYGLNNFFIAPLIRRVFEVKVGIKGD